MATDKANPSGFVRLAFKVPKGFEDIAWQDIKRFIPTEVSTAAVADGRLELLSGFVLLSLPVGVDLEACLSRYAQGVFWAVTRVLLSMQALGEALDDLPTISEDMCRGLEADRKSLPSKRSRQIINPEASKGRNNRYRRRVAPLDIDSTPSEVDFLDRLKHIADSQNESHRALFRTWKAFKGEEPTGDHSRIPESFAIRFDRGSFLFPSLKSSKIASHLADLYGAHVMDMTGRDDLKADLTSPEYEISAELVHDKGNLHYFSGICLPKPTSPEHRANRLQGRTTMLPERAYCLCLLHPVLRNSEDGRKSMAFLDPCSGFGSIPLEIAAIARREKLNIISFSADNEYPSLQKGMMNATNAHLDSKAGLHGIECGILWSGRGAGFSGGFREGTLDGVVSDLPWGIKELTPRAISALYPALLRFLGHAVVDGGYGVFLCQRETIFLGAVKSNDWMWEVSEHRTVDVEGVQAHAFVVKRKSRSSVGA